MAVKTNDFSFFMKGLRSFLTPWKSVPVGMYKYIQDFLFNSMFGNLMKYQNLASEKVNITSVAQITTDGAIQLCLADNFFIFLQIIAIPG